jgi:hypothetical protein
MDVAELSLSLGEAAAPSSGRLVGLGLQCAPEKGELSP